MARKDMIATASFRYQTRRLRPGDPFQASDRDARVLVGVKKAREGRIPGRVAPPPPDVADKIADRAPKSDLLDLPIKDITPKLASLSDEQLRGHLADEQRGKTRKGLIAAIQAEIDSREV